MSPVCMFSLTFAGLESPDVVRNTAVKDAKQSKASMHMQLVTTHRPGGVMPVTR